MSAMAILDILNMTGIIAASMAGALVAIRKNMDLFGLIIVSCCTALGGGTLRDIILGNFPVSWVKDPIYFVVATGAGLMAVCFLSGLLHKFRLTFLFLDAIGFIAFTIVGVDAAIELQQSFFVASVAGVLTGVFGGVIRDIFCDEIPLVFRKEIYAIISILSAWLYIFLREYLMLDIASILITIFCGCVLRMLAVYFCWSIPIFFLRIKK